MTAIPRARSVLGMGVDAIAAVTVLAAAADERQVIVEQVAAGTQSVVALGDGRVELRVRIDVDTLQAIEDAAETALPEPDEPLTP